MAVRDAKGRFVGKSNFKMPTGQFSGLDLQVQLSGVKEVTKALAQFHPTLQKKLQRRATRRAAKPVQDTAKSLAPIRTGTLRKNILIRAIKRKRGSRIIGAKVVTATRERLGIDEDDKFYYPAIMEYGAASRNIPARPYLRPAMDANRDKVRAIYKVELKINISAAATQLRQGKIDRAGKKIK